MSVTELLAGLLQVRIPTPFPAHQFRYRCCALVLKSFQHHARTLLLRELHRLLAARQPHHCCSLHHRHPHHHCTPPPAMGAAPISEARKTHPDHRCRCRCRRSPLPRRSCPPLAPPASRKGTARTKPRPQRSTQPAPRPPLSRSVCVPCCFRRRGPGAPRRRRGVEGEGQPGGPAVAAHWRRCRRGGSLAGSREPRRGSGRTYADVRFAASPPNTRLCQWVVRERLLCH